MELNGTRASPRTSADIVVIGSGMGGATIARGLAETGLNILILERGRRLLDSPEARDHRAVYQRGWYRSDEQWHDVQGGAFSPGNFYNVGGNSKFYGAVLYRYRKEDFTPRRHSGGSTPGWPFAYEELEPWYTRAEAAFRVRGTTGEDPTEPPHSAPYSYPPVPDEPPLAEVRRRLKANGLHPASLPLAIDIDAWLRNGQTPWDGFPETRGGKIDAETGPLAEALAYPNVELAEDTQVVRLQLEPDGKRIAGVVCRRGSEDVTINAGMVFLAAGAINSAAILLRSTDVRSKGVANGSDQVGRNFMNHNCTAMITMSPRLPNPSIYQKTFGINDFYNGDGAGGLPLGNVQLLGKISGPILKGSLPRVPEWLLNRIAKYSFDWYLMSEDLPSADSRVKVDGDRIVLDWQRSNLEGHAALVKRMREVFRSIGFPIVLARPFDKKTPSHQCGTAKMGTDAATSVVDTFGRSHDHANLYVVDASILPTSAAVNPALTVAALAMRTSDHLVKGELKRL